MAKHEEKCRDERVIFYDVLGLLNDKVDRYKFDTVFVSPSSEEHVAVVRAREACLAAMRPVLSKDLQLAPIVSTRGLANKILVVVSKIHRDSARLDSLKPTVQKNDVARDVTMRKGKLDVKLERYKTRLRVNDRQTLVIDSSDGNRLKARVEKVEGKAATVVLSGSGASRGSQLLSVTTLGKEKPTGAEQSKELILLRILQGKTPIETNIVFRAIWMAVPKPRRPIMPTPLDAVTSELNPSQHLAVLHAVAPLAAGSVDVQVVRGPPGTGKTTMIAAAVQALRAAGQTVWLVAQSNVAVKNMAVKLAKVDFEDFRLLVSKDFHFDWHEHLYNKIQNKIVRSDNFPKTELEVERVLAGSKVLLCTLSMLSNSSLREVGFTRVVPVQTLIVDEASQIELGDFLSPAHAFGSTLQRLIFVGDDKQLAPYGQDDLGNLKSIFEVNAHSSGAIMLDTCYRLPTPICRYISKHVYESRLQSHHDIKSSTSCRFIDVAHGKEKKSGTSWTNEQEANMCIAVARQLYLSGRREFRIITPYDPQRALIEKKLKEMQGTGRVPWEDRVFCVDSFQGNEAEHIIISVVRTTRPGFMRNLRRTNVMLTRCKLAMYICASRSFLQSDAGQETLVGKMAREWEQFAGWRTGQDVLNGRV
ncbi:P-loop containing nucleoside triphosphate hydrolase protein [Exidia glandulosa HHB12029]|uniref:p-loop containing nucleoside triphosphate hydrolase protein n=1 Tax=Exidia glandulosa HHB12029 TaxID=1314781 RepID=A0A165HY28_EXIGL|nr:P-loop containing nucleoside triphosphate hydrolase protein [Exidia glandulosa HHB12029]